MNRTILIALLSIAFCGVTSAQKGDKNFAAGIVVAVPQTKDYVDFQSWNTGIGIEGIGQYYLTNKSSLLLQLQVIQFTGRYYFGSSGYPTDFTSISLKGGYRYDFSPDGFYANILAGVELNGMYTPATLGFGKRFRLKKHFIDAGLEYTGGQIPHYSIRAVYSLFEERKEE
jgi:hypothetical protein